MKEKEAWSPGCCVVTEPEPALALMEMHSSILVVEDRFDLAVLMEAKLESQGYAILVAHDGIKGLEMALHEKTAVIVLDQFLPGMSGMDVLEALKEDSRTSEIPVIFLLSTRDENPDPGTILERGAARVLAKPLDVDKLVQEVTRFVPEGGSWISLGS